MTQTEMQVIVERLETVITQLEEVKTNLTEIEYGEMEDGEQIAVDLDDSDIESHAAALRETKDEIESIAGQLESTL